MAAGDSVTDLHAAMTNPGAGADRQVTQLGINDLLFVSTRLNHLFYATD